MSFLPFVRIWIVVSALASVAGWILSMIQELNGRGYFVAGIAGMVLLFAMRRPLMQDAAPFRWQRVKRRFSRIFPLAFAGLALLVFLGGALYHPNNYDGLTYRVPRVLHWLADQQWHWIHTVNYRMNDRSCGFEWLMAPLFVATHSDRFLFLINFVPFLLMPGLVFSVFTRLSVSTRMSWHWMWLLPSGYNFLLQAGSIGNDAFAAVYALAALDFALRASTSKRMSDIWLSLLAAALLTGAKPGNLPLLLPWIIMFAPLLSKLCSKPLASLGVTLSALTASFLPTALMNSIHCGDWTGLNLEAHDIAMQHPLAGILGNSAMFLISNFAPPIFPLAGWWNQHAMSFLPDNLSTLLLANFEVTFYRLGEIPTEEWAGLGFGLSSLLLATMLLAWFERRHPASSNGRPVGRAGFIRSRRIMLVSPYLALLFFFAKSGMMTVTRLVSAYYPLMLPVLISGPTKAGLVRRRWWRWSAFAVMLMAAAVLVLTPARPLWPVQTFFSAIGDMSSKHPFAGRVKNVYLVYADRPDTLARVREALPEDCDVVGFAAGCNDNETSLWRPFGHRQVKDILPSDSWAQIRARQIQYAVVAENFLTTQHQTLQAWLQQHRATLITSVTVTVFASDAPQVYHVVHLE